ncbi:MAG: TIR domain-containing protein, partial [Verrucomicrobiaceae bacterium]
MAGVENPVLLVQNRCDRPEDKRLRLPVAPEELEAFPFCQVLQYSALNQRGQAALEESLRDAVSWLREHKGHARIGIGRLAVKNRLEALLAQDATIDDPSQRRHRTLSMEDYKQICTECKNVSSPALLLEYLHLSGIVLHLPGHFGDRIILDQRWALEAVYSVFNRDKCFRQLKQLHGRMTRTLLELIVWDKYSEKEQELLLGIMLSCGICFIHRKGHAELGIETEYIAPDLLPDRAAVAHELAARWEDERPFDEAAVELPFPHPGVMRALLSRIGNLAGMAPVYWRDGVCLHERTHRSHALIEQRLEEKPPVVVIRTCEGESLSLLRELAQWVREAAECSGLREVHLRLPESTDAMGRTAMNPGIPGRQPSASLIFDAMPPSEIITYAVSYALRDQSKETVERLCRKAEARGIRIMRDVTDVGLGEKLSKFMTSLAGQDRVFVILSDAYLRSENCMFELSEIWRLCQQDDSRFHERVRVFRLPDARIYDFPYQLEITEYWERRQQEVREQVAALAGKGTLSEAMLRRFKNLKAFAERAGEIVPGIADRLLTEDFEEFVRHGFPAGKLSLLSNFHPVDSPVKTPMLRKVFLSHNSADKPEVEALALRLSREDGIEPWLDKWNLIPGQSWQEEIEEAMRECDCCAVFIGRGDPEHGVLGPWQNAEMRALISRQVTERGARFAVIPVLLPGAERSQYGKLPTFLVANT